MRDQCLLEGVNSNDLTSRVEKEVRSLVEIWTPSSKAKFQKTGLSVLKHMLFDAADLSGKSGRAGDGS